MPAERASPRALWPAWLLASAAAFGQTTPPPCVSLPDDKARLACYDQLHGRAPPPAAATAAPSATPAAAPSISTSASQVDTRWDLDGRSRALFEPRAYRPVYLLPATWTSRVNRNPASPTPDHAVTDALELRAMETKYQVSLKAKLAQRVLGTPASLWGGYTQSSRWQVFNGPASRPFRETNYEPELMLVWPLDGQWLGWQLRMASLSLNHQSNGRSLPLSRSWNRIIGALVAERGEWSIELRPWLRMPEERSDDDNPDIEDHIGRGELLIGRHWGDHALQLQLRHSLRGGARSRGSVQLDWVFPLSGALHGYFQIFSGQGESLVDYNVQQNKVGLGITIAGWR